LLSEGKGRIKPYAPASGPHKRVEGTPKHTDRQVRAQLARRIQQARAACGWTREQLAEALGLQAVQTFWKYETGRLSISATMLYRLAETLGIPVEALVTRAGATKSEAALLLDRCAFGV
jgi:ribosome-binding protein aMBF1 (putative translation factor)